MLPLEGREGGQLMLEPDTRTTWLFFGTCTQLIQSRLLRLQQQINKGGRQLEEPSVMHSRQRGNCSLNGTSFLTVADLLRGRIAQRETTR